MTTRWLDPVVRAASAGLMTAVVAGCGLGLSSTPPDPRAVLIDALHQTAALHTVHATVNVEIRDARSTYQATIDGDVDLVARELNFSGTFRPNVFGATTVRLVVADGRVFSTTGRDWSVSGGTGRDPLAGIPSITHLTEALASGFADPATQVELLGAEPCGDSTCHRIRLVMPREVAWRTFVTMFDAMYPTNADPPIPRDFPGIAVEAWVTEGSHRLVKASNLTIVGQQSFAIEIALSNHDAPVTIEPPIGA